MAVLRQPLRLENMSVVSAVSIAKHCSCKVLPFFLMYSMFAICTSLKALLYVQLGLDYYNSGAPYHMYRHLLHKATIINDCDHLSIANITLHTPKGLVLGDKDYIGTRLMESSLTHIGSCWRSKSKYLSAKKVWNQC